MMQRWRVPQRRNPSFLLGNTDLGPFGALSSTWYVCRTRHLPFPSASLSKACLSVPWHDNCVIEVIFFVTISF